MTPPSLDLLTIEDRVDGIGSARVNTWPTVHDVGLSIVRCDRVVTGEANE